MQKRAQQFSKNFLKFRKFQEKNKQLILDSFERLAFQRVSLDPEAGEYENIHLLYRLLPTLEGYSDIFDDDTINIVTEYDKWLDAVMDFIRAVDPWFHAILLDGEPQGAMWATNWESFGGGAHSVEMGGMAKRKVNPIHTMATMYQFVSGIFEQSDVYIIRAEFAANDRAVKRCLTRLGFSHPETRRCLKIRNGREITGTILSMTRPEWEALHVEQEEEKQEQ